MLKQEYKVFGLDINQFDTKILQELEGGKYLEHFTFHQANLLEEGACDKAVAACLEKFGYVSIPLFLRCGLSHESFEPHVQEAFLYCIIFATMD